MPTDDPKPNIAEFISVSCDVSIARWMSYSLAFTLRLSII